MVSHSQSCYSVMPFLSQAPSSPSLLCAGDNSLPAVPALAAQDDQAWGQDHQEVYHDGQKDEGAG